MSIVYVKPKQSICWRPDEFCFEQAFMKSVFLQRRREHSHRKNSACCVWNMIYECLILAAGRDWLVVDSGW